MWTLLAILIYPGCWFVRQNGDGYVDSKAKEKKIIEAVKSALWAVLCVQGTCVSFGELCTTQVFEWNVFLFPSCLWRANQE